MFKEVIDGIVVLNGYGEVRVGGGCLLGISFLCLGFLFFLKFVVGVVFIRWVVGGRCLFGSY